MKNFLYFPLFSFLSLFAANGFEQYETLFKDHPKMMGPSASASEGEIEIVLDEPKVDAIRQKKYDELREQGITTYYADKWTRVGVVAMDQDWWMIREAVELPGGRGTLLDRLIPNLVKSAAVLPVTEKGDVLLLLTFAHATRSWELEIPRADSKVAATAEEAARALVKDRLGKEVKSITLLGEVNPDSSLLAKSMPVFVAKVDADSLPKGVVAVPIEELKRSLVKGSLNGNSLRDPYLTYALYLLTIAAEGGSPRSEESHKSYQTAP